MSKITKEDIYAYLLKKNGLSASNAKMLCKLKSSFENIVHSDYENDFFQRFTNGINEEESFFDDAKTCFIKAKKASDLILKNEIMFYREAEEFYKTLNEKGIKWTHLTREDYPERLKDITDPPVILFYKGNMIKDDVPSVAIIGARECSPYGEKAAALFGRELALAGVQIISGMARGIDGISQRSAINASGSSFGILGCGVDVVYPRENNDIFKSILENGGILSEFEPGTQPLRQYFPSRNRIISGLADIVLVIEAKKKSGTYITVSQALEQGREVFALPGRITDALSEGCNRLIASGAGAAISSESIIDSLRLKYKYRDFGVIKEESIKNTELTGLRRDIYDFLKQDSMTLSVLSEKLKKDISVEELTSELVEMEADGLLVKIGNMYYNK